MDTKARNEMIAKATSEYADVLRQSYGSTAEGRAASLLASYEEGFRYGLDQGLKHNANELRDLRNLRATCEDVYDARDATDLELIEVVKRENTLLMAIARAVCAHDDSDPKNPPAEVGWRELVRAARVACGH